MASARRRRTTVSAVWPTGRGHTIVAMCVAGVWLARTLKASTFVAVKLLLNVILKIALALAALLLRGAAHSTAHRLHRRRRLLLQALRLRRPALRRALRRPLLAAAAAALRHRRRAALLLRPRRNSLLFVLNKQLKLLL